MKLLFKKQEASGARGWSLNLQVYYTVTQWKLLWFTNFYYLTVSQNIPLSVSSLLIKGVLQEVGAQNCQDDITNS